MDNSTLLPRQLIRISKATTNPSLVRKLWQLTHRKVDPYMAPHTHKHTHADVTAVSHHDVQLATCVAMCKSSSGDAQTPPREVAHNLHKALIPLI